MKTRTVVQIRTHAQKYFQKMDKMKEGKMGKPSSFSAPDSKDDTRKSSSRSSSITSDDNMDTDNDTDVEEFKWGDAFAESVETPKKRPREKQPTKNSRVSKRPNLGQGLTLSLAEPTFEFFNLPTDEGPDLDQSISHLLEKIDSSVSRCHSPFMDSAASVCSSLDTLQESFNFFEFGCNTELSTPRTTTISSMPSAHPVEKQRLAFSHVLKEMQQVFRSYQIGSYDRLPSIRTLLSMRSSSISVSCTKNLTPSHTTFCHYQIPDSPNLFGDDHDFHPIGMGEVVSLEHPASENTVSGEDTELLSPTPRKRGRPRKNSVSSV